MTDVAPSLPPKRPATESGPTTRRTLPSRMGRGRAALAAGLALPLLLAACGGASTTTNPAATKTSTSAGAGSAHAVSAIKVTIKNFAYSPDTFTVAPGAKITVTNLDSLQHTFTDMNNTKLFTTGLLNPNQSVTITAPTTPGSYQFFCLIHNYMTGTMKVS